MKQLTLEDVVGSFDYKATSTAEQFLAKTPVITTYAVDFFDKDLRQKLRWFEAETKSEAEGMARKKYGKIQIVNTYISDRTLKEIMELD
ncbi:hypothetical protein P4388_31855 [Bacillus thuringiensis]|uniref:Uncharacterized protein n=1 Tax=Bacillus thuringiensis serovar mexicanensis TaxID=180868 RepID=A0A242W0F0_BACTU|nr:MULTISPECIES: hypothetical protein [Bacillus cereus group]MED3353112.1 hypothetical protein [Bacillus thuringiensis]MEB9673318.1 hypothetical protein [Bacillus anthracis]OTW44024.1 hypothetical protein BK699_33550 [Bacillus thuringiensis serovar mexicanensis]OTW73602.1 hypothetical protein BK707_01955 [Bacillus thuringiensis serovar coreanensis]OTX04796.1 hypothetical protein BK705_12915 [Bacillus thuringiensis serovar monterrey]